MRVFAFEPSFVVVLVPFVMQQIQLVNQALLFENFEGSIDGDAADLGVARLGQLVKAVGV